MPLGPRRLAIIGSGPAGYTAALYAARAELEPVLFEGATTPGGALVATTLVENFPGHPHGITGPELMARLRVQVERFGCEFVREDATRLELARPTKRLETTGGEVHDFDAVVLAMGASHKELGLPHEARLTGRGVSSCATCDGAFYRGRPVAVVGGGDSALEEALFLTRFASLVTLIHRRRSFRASKVVQERVLEHPRIDVRWNTEVTALVGAEDLESIAIRDVDTGRIDQLGVSGLFVAIGHHPNSGLVRGQLPLDDGGYVLVDHPSTATELPGVFACGDLVDRRYRQAVTAAASGCAAALDAEHYLWGVPRTPGHQVRNVDPRMPAAPAEDDQDEPHVTAESVDDEALADALSRSAVPVLVDFWADNCAPCQLMHPVVDRVARRYADRLHVVKINVNANPSSAGDHAVTTAPTIKLFIHGQVAHTMVGATPESRLTAELDPFLA